VERVSLSSDGLRLVAEVHRPVSQAPHPALCLCHGVPAGRAPDPSDGGYPLLAERFCAGGFLVLIFNFRGCGESDGNFDIMGWTRDLEAAVDYLWHLEDVDRVRLSVMGFSGGAVAAVYCGAQDERVSSVAACACPARFFDIAEFSKVEEFLEHCRQVNIIRDPEFPQSVDEWARGFEDISPLKHIDAISPRSLLILHGGSDETVPPEHAWELYSRAKEPKEIKIVEGGEHKLRLSEPAMNAALFWLKRANGLNEED
jgi:dipeptidyl aminopeptidase/acylaminoacyl peptidase